jgi:hypothetical protein
VDERAKISVSLPDDLKARLDAYAEEHQQSVSQVQRYVTALAANHEQVRSSLQLISEMSATQGVFIPCPAPLGAPPWVVKS